MSKENSKYSLELIKSIYDSRVADGNKMAYISGKMTGIKDFNKPKFDKAKKHLEKQGYEVISPADLGEINGYEWSDYMKVDVAAMMMCDIVFLLDDWKLSKGAKIEVEIAKNLGIQVVECEKGVES